MLSRRDFLKTSSLSLALLASGISPWRQAHAQTGIGTEYLALCDTAEELKSEKATFLVTNPGSVKLLNVATNETIAIDAPFYGHTVAQNPKTPYQLTTFEKWGKRGALVDVKEKALISTVEADEGHVFVGHAAYINGGDVLVTAEDSYSRDNGELVLRDPSSFKIIQKMSSYGTEPHDCRALDRKTLVVMNTGGKKPNSLVWAETVSGKMLHQVVFDYEPSLSLRHFDLSADGWICAVGFLEHFTVTPAMAGKPFMTSRIAFVSPDGKVLPLAIPDDTAAVLNGQALSVSFLPGTDLVAATLPSSNFLLLFNYKTQELVNVIKIHVVNGVLPDIHADRQPAVIVSRDKDRDLMRLALSPEGKETARRTDASFGGTGSHLARIYI